MEEVEVVEEVVEEVEDRAAALKAGSVPGLSLFAQSMDTVSVLLIVQGEQGVVLEQVEEVAVAGVVVVVEVEEVMEGVLQQILQ